MACSRSVARVRGQWARVRKCPVVRGLRAPQVYNGHRCAFRLGGQLVAEDVAEEAVNNRMEPLFGEAIPVLFGVPDVDVPQPALGTLEGDVGDESLRWLVADAIGDALVEGGVDGNVLGECVGHGDGLSKI